MISDLFRAFYDWPLGTIVAVSFVSVFVFLVWVCIDRLFYLIDSCNLPLEKGEGVVVERFYHASTDLLISEMVIPNGIPEDWSVKFEVKGRGTSVQFYVSHSQFNSLLVGRRVMVNYQIGRLSGRIYIKRFKL